MANKIPCPLNDADCEQLANLIQTIPVVQQIVRDCADCDIQIPGAAESLERSLRVATSLQSLIAKHFVTNTTAAS